MHEQKIITYLQDIKKIVDNEIDDVLQNDNRLIDGLMKSAVYSSSGGKRVRAVFTYLVGQMFGIEKEKLIKSACSIELIHAASLIMDDLPYMDDSQLRRGKPANHVVFGQDVALLASIGLLSKASQIVFKDPQLTSDQKIKVTEILTNSFGFDGLAAGQFVDLKLKDKHIDFEIIEFINDKKTAALFTAAGKVAAIIGGAAAKQLSAIETFSENIGFAFQIVDDMIDIAGDKKIVGKDVGHDKMNFVKLVGKEEAERYLKDYHKKAEDALTGFGSKADELKSFSRYLLERIK